MRRLKGTATGKFQCLNADDTNLRRTIAKDFRRQEMTISGSMAPGQIQGFRDAQSNCLWGQTRRLGSPAAHGHHTALNDMT